MNESGPHKLVYLDAQLLRSGTVGRIRRYTLLGAGVVLFKKVTGDALRLQKPMASPVSLPLLAALMSGCKALAYCHSAMPVFFPL